MSKESDKMLVEGMAPEAEVPESETETEEERETESGLTTEPKSKRGRPRKGAKTGKEMKKYPCSACGRDVGKSGCVKCSVCLMWCHTKCSGRETIPDNGRGFVCPKCSESGEVEEILKSMRKDKVEENEGNELNEKETDESKKRSREINKDESIGTDEASPKGRNQREESITIRVCFLSQMKMIR